MDTNIQRNRIKGLYFFIIIFGLAIVASAFYFKKISLEKKLDPDVFVLRRPASEYFPIAKFNLSLQKKLRLRGSYWTFLYFGYSRCRDVCPMTLSLISHAFNDISSDLKYQALFVQLDDSLNDDNLLLNYTHNFDNRIQSYALSKAERAAILKWAGASYEVNPDKTISHTTSIFLVDPDGQIVGEFINPSNSKKVAEQFALVANLIEK
jgi:protein SCO1